MSVDHNNCDFIKPSNGYTGTHYHWHQVQTDRRIVSLLWALLTLSLSAPSNHDHDHQIIWRPSKRGYDSSLSVRFTKTISIIVHVQQRRRPQQRDRL